MLCKNHPSRKLQKKKPKGVNQWLHPDLVGVYLPYGDYSDATINLQEKFNANSFKIFSFEMKLRIDFLNLRECFFQAVSNSSWANEGYLVCESIDEDIDFRNELQRLSNSFGIGVIELNPIQITDSTIIFPAKIKDNIDWDTVNRLSEESPDFTDFLKNISDDIKINKVKSNYDIVLTDDELDEYLIKKNFNE